DVHDGMIVEAIDRAAGSVRLPPVGAEGESPPLPPVAQVDCMCRRREDQRAGLEHVRQRSRILLRIRRDLCISLKSGVVDELAKLPIGDWHTVNPEIVHAHSMYRSLFGIVTIGPHAERATANETHVGMCWVSI